MKVQLNKTKEFYNTMYNWIEGHGLKPLRPSMLPENTFVCYNDQDVPVYSMCFYNTDSHLCWIGFPISNPSISKEDTKGCFDLLFKAAEEYAKQLGYDIMFTTSNTKSVVKTLENNDYLRGDIGVDQFFKNIG